MKNNILTWLIFLYVNFVPSIVWQKTILWWRTYQIEWLEIRLRLEKRDNEELKERLAKLEQKLS